MPCLRQGKYYFVREPDFLAWLKKYLAGEFTSGRKAVWKEPEETASEQFSTAKSA
jgi:hypothetical protein